MRLGRGVDLLLTAAVALALVAGADAVVLARLSASQTDVLDAALQRAATSVGPSSTAVCSLTVPDSPLSAAGLTTPYRLTGKDPQTGPCHEATLGQSAFVEAVIYDPAGHALSVYRPLVVDDGDQPAAVPVPVSLPRHAVVGVWISFSGRTLSLTGPGAQRCVDGVHGSPFGTFAYCNARAFFSAVRSDRKVPIPALGSGKDGLPCPTSRDITMVDQDQSDDVATGYRVVGGRIAQDTAATRGGQPLTSGPDHRLLAGHVDPALGCRPFLAPDLTDGGAPTPALALDELLAGARQAHPALVPANAPVVRAQGRTGAAKVNAFRAGVNQAAIPAGDTGAGYCARLAAAAPSRLHRDAALLSAAGSPAPGAANLLVFLRQRLQATVWALHCGRASARAVAAATGAGTQAGTGASTPGTGTASGATAASSSTSSAAPAPGSIQWGTSVWQYGSESYAQALARDEQALHPVIIRSFVPGTNGPSWTKAAQTYPVVISFKIPPAQVLDGSHDAQLASFFAATPRPTYWSYWHEPEDEVAAGTFTAAQYRAAWSHIAAIARASGKPLRATLILMSWTAVPASHRTWTDFYPGPQDIDVLAWDAYAWDSSATPEKVYGPVRDASVKAGKPWAIAETGASAATIPDVAQRHALLTGMSRYLATSSPKPEFVTYFDADPPGAHIFYDWSITKNPSDAAAWLAGMAG